MNDVRRARNPEVLPRRGDDLDGLLRRFFRSEMPDRWPAPPQLPLPARPRPRGRFRPSARLALAAAVSFFVVGYLALAAAFPSSSPGVVSPGVRPETGYNAPRESNP